MKNLSTYVATTAISLSLVGCLDSNSKTGSATTETKSELNSTAPKVQVLAKASSQICDSFNEGALYFDPTQQAFEVCSNGVFQPIYLRGPKGDTGEKGDAGLNGAAGAVGPSGVNGRDGVDGNGVRLALRDGNNQILAILIQYNSDPSVNTAALVKYPNGDMTYVNPKTGWFVMSRMNVYFTGEDCTGEAYTGRSDQMGPHVLGRIYPTRNDYWGVNRFYRAVAYNDLSKTFKSVEVYDTAVATKLCENRTISTGALVRVERTTAPTMLQDYAPLQFTF